MRDFRARVTRLERRLRLRNSYSDVHQASEEDERTRMDHGIGFALIPEPGDPPEEPIQVRRV
jgi:hypothetical protein